MGFVDKIVNGIKTIGNFLKDVRIETKKVSFPTRKEVSGTTGVIIVVVIIFGTYLWIIDSLFSKTWETFLDWIGSRF